MNVPFFKTKKNPLFVCTSDLFGRICTKFLFKRWIIFATVCQRQQMCIVAYKNFAPAKDNQQKEIHPHVVSSSTEDDDAEEVLFPVHFPGVFFNLCTQTAVWKRVSLKPNYSSVAPWHLNRSPSHFWGSSHHFFDFLGWWCGIKKKKFQKKIRKKHNAYHLLESTSPKFPPSFPRFPKFQRDPPKCLGILHRIHRGVRLEVKRPIWKSSILMLLGNFSKTKNGWDQVIQSDLLIPYLEVT